MKENTKRTQRRSQWEQMKNRPLKYKVAYLATYYHNQALLLLAVIAVLVYLVIHAISAKEIILHVTVHNVWLQKELDIEAVEHDFLAFGELDSQKHEIILEEDLTMDTNGNGAGFSWDITKVASELASGEMDVMLTTDTWIRQYRDKGMFADLSEILPKELLEAYKDKIYYLNSIVDDKGEFPVAIDVSESTLMLSPDLPAYFCIPANAENLDNAALFLRYLLER